MPTPVIPLGPLKDWVVGSNTYTFRSFASKLLPGWSVGISNIVTAGVMGQKTVIDRAGNIQMPVTYDFTWEYQLKWTGTSYGQPQTDLSDILVTMVGGQVGTLSVYSVDGTVPITNFVSARARFVSLFDATPDGSITQKTLNLRFLVPGGFSV